MVFAFLGYELNAHITNFGASRDFEMLKALAVLCKEAQRDVRNIMATAKIDACQFRSFGHQKLDNRVGNWGMGKIEDLQIR